MPSLSIRHIGARPRAIASAMAAACATLPFWAGAQATPAGADAPGAGAAGRQRVSLYSVINLGPEPLSAELNERGQAAFTTLNSFGIRSWFFDGERTRDIGSLGGGDATVYALNNKGVVVGNSSTGEVRNRVLGFVWSAAAGMRALPGESPTTANDINDHNVIVGVTEPPPQSGLSARAVRWNPDGGVTLLGPPPFSLSEASAVNHRGYATGYADLPDTISATVWDPAGNQTDLGSLDRQLGFGEFINERNEVAGVVDGPGEAQRRGFFWSRDTGMVPIDAGGILALSDLNNRGEIVGGGLVAGAERAFQWTLGRGLVPLPLGPDAGSYATDINEHGEVAGITYAAAGGAMRAVRWPAYDAAPIDLNTRLYRAPPGLVLRAAVAINDNGLILADSNAGLVMLRPGRRGTDAPVAGPIAGLPRTVTLGQTLAPTIDFVDDAGAHTASVTWQDGCASSTPTVVESGGSGQARLQHTFCAAGFNAVRVRITDAGGHYTELEQDYLVEAPTVAALSGSGTLPAAAATVGSAAARHLRAAPLRFAVWAPLAGAVAGTGAPALRLSGPFHFNSERVTGVTTSGRQARVEGVGRLNGRDGYRFALEARDGAAAQGGGRLRLRITHVDAATGAERADYDNGATAAAADRTALTEGALTLRN
nr:hypothetical protein [uncultured Duganella sp.]